MELVEGKTLREMLVAGSIPLRRLLGIASQLADGLAQAHASGIVHRDLKPENVMVTRQDLVKILDFGLAKLASAKDDEAHAVGASTLTEATKPGLFMGTVGYMSPEQASGHPVDFRSDQFSLGSILYEMATGRSPFKRATSAQTLAAIIQEEPEPISSINPTLPAPVRWIVERCLAKEPRRRYASTEDLARELATVRDGLSEIMSGKSIGPAANRPGPIRREFVAWLAVALFATVAALVLVRRPSGNPAPMRRASLVVPDIKWLAPISPDGQRIVYRSEIADGRSALLLRELADENARPLPDTDDAYAPFWSPDSQTIAFFNNPPGGNIQVKQIGIKDTSAVVVCSTTVTSITEGTWERTTSSSSGP